jgi:hypothetical protein
VSAARRSAATTAPLPSGAGAGGATSAAGVPARRRRAAAPPAASALAPSGTGTVWRRPRARAPIDLRARRGMCAPRDDEYAASRERRGTVRTLRAGRLLVPEHAAERAGEARRADEEKRARAEEERPHAALQVGVGLAVAHEDLRAVGACRRDRGG